MARQTFAAGRFYPDHPETLLEELDALIPPMEDAGKKAVIGALVPHAGYMYSGRVAGDVYARIRARETYIVLGPNHTGVGDRFSLSLEDWETPLGDMRVDTELAGSIMDQTRLVSSDPSAHAMEHCVEVQLPFIKKMFPEAGFVPLVVSCGDIDELRSIGQAIASSIRSSGKKVTILASSDMTHYEPRDSASVKDKKAIDALMSMDGEKLAETVLTGNISMCGWVPSVIMLFASKELGAVTPELVRYSDSGEVTGNSADVVGYAGMIIS